MVQPQLLLLGGAGISAASQPRAAACVYVCGGGHQPLAAVAQERGLPAGPPRGM